MNLAKAVRINLFDFQTVPMRTFHMTWFAFFLSFWGWFSVAPLMAVIREDLHLSKVQIGNIMIASVAVTIFVRLVMGWLCDKIGPRKAYSLLLILGAFPIMGIGLSHNYEQFLFFRLAIGAIGASFVITQYHTSVMFAPNCVGTANAAAAGWGNMGGGFAQVIMPLILAGLASLGIDHALGWRLSMLVPGIALFIMGFVYLRYTQDFPEGNMSVHRKHGGEKIKGTLLIAAKDHRVWALAGMYAASFGVELTLNNVASLYFVDQFKLSVIQAGLLAGSFGFMNLFARALGGLLSDRCAARGGLKARVSFMGMTMFIGGVCLLIFSKMTVLPLAIVTMLIFALFIKMTNGAVYSIVPFINKKALGAVAGIIGAGGNLGGVLFGFLFRSDSLTYSTALFYLGMMVGLSSLCAFAVRFSIQDETRVQNEIRGSGILKEEIASATA